MNRPKIKSLLLKVVKYTGLNLIGILILLLVFPLFFKDRITDQVKIIANKQLKTKLDLKEVNLTFFEHFPILTATISDMELKGSAPFEKETLLKAKSMSLGIDISSLFSDRIVIDRFYLDNAEINVQVDAAGFNNYNILNSAEEEATDQSAADNETNLAIRIIKIANSKLIYNDRSIPFNIKAMGLNYEGRGDLSSTIIQLKTKATIDSFWLAFNGESYIENKALDADLLTNINTNTLSFIFERNDLKVNDLPIKFRGSFGFLSNGYQLDFKVRTNKSTIANMLSVLPPAYAQWVKDTKVKGDGEAFMDLSGQYIAEKSKMPDLKFGLKLQDGQIAYQNAAIPLEHLNMGLRIDLPNLNLDSLKINLDTLSFQVAEGRFNSRVNTRGLLPLYIQGDINANLDLGAIHKALGIDQFDFKGLFKLNGKIDGKYATAVKHSGIRQIDTVISSIPLFNFNSSLKNGYFKFAALKQPIETIEFNLQALAKDTIINHSTFSITEVNIKALTNYIKGYVHIQDIQKMKLDADFKSEIDLASIKQFYPIDSVDLKGDLSVHLKASGQIDMPNKKFPKTLTSISLKNGLINSWAYPIPIEDIAIEAYVKSDKGSFKDLQIKVLPISFKIANEPFFLRANLENLNNVKYDIKSKGKLILEPFYKIFGIEGMNVGGYVKTNFSLAGLQNDAIKGYYNRLNNRGSIEIGKISIASDLFPHAFYLNKGKFVFNKEKLKFNHITSQYKDNQLTLNGYLDNYINYLTTATDKLQGQMIFTSPKLDLNDFMVFAETTNVSTSPTSPGVILIPENLALGFKAHVSQIKYNTLLIKNFEGDLGVDHGNIALSAAKFDLAGMQVNMNGGYSPIHTKRAKFNYNIQADNFDIQRAYKEIPLFQEMVSSAKNAHGNISLNYELAGLLDANMSPVLPTVTGQGKLTLENIKFKGFKLLNNIAKETDHGKLNDAAVSKVTINSAIKNNVMTIERTKMKVGFLRPRFEGQVTLDGKMNMNFRLGLPPFGIFGIPLTISGTQDKPTIKLGKYKEKELDTDMDEDDKKLYEAEQALKKDSTQVIL